MKRLRSAIFWVHLFTGATAGLVILIMCATGAVLALKPQIVNAIDRGVRNVVPQDYPRLAISQLLVNVQVSRQDASAVSVTVERDPSRSVAIGLDRAGNVYLDPYTGALLGEGSRAQAFFRTIENWHRWIGMPGENRGFARSVTGACTIAFLVLAISGFYLWWPRKWTVQHTRPIVAFRRATTSRARDFMT